MNLPCRKPDLYQFSPHQGRMLLLDSVESYDLDKNSITATVEVGDESEFLKKNTGKIPVRVSFEYMAQSIAVLAGINHREKGNEPKIGFIMGIRDFRAETDGFAVKDRVTIKVEQTFRDGDVAVFEGQAVVDEKICATAVVNVIESSEELIGKWLSEQN